VVASIGYSTSADLGEAVSFSAAGSIDPDGEIVKYLWHFGDGTTALGKNVKHTYSVPGSYVIYVDAEDDEGGKANTIAAPVFIKINRPQVTELSLDLPPVAIIGASASVVKVGEEVEVSGGASYHYRLRRGAIQSYSSNVKSWSFDFGDGSVSSGKTATHTYDEPGSYSVVLTVTNKLNAKEDSVARTIIVTEEPVSYQGIVKNPDTLIMAMGAPSHLEPMRLSEGNVGRWIDLALFDTLMAFLPGGTEPSLEGGLAKDLDVSADGLTYTFTLRDGIKFWDGSALTAHDVVYTYRRSMGKGMSWGALLVEPLLGIEYGEPITTEALEDHIYATDDKTVVFKLSRTYGPFLFTVAYPGRGIIQKAAAIEAGSWYLGDTRDWSIELDPAFEDVEGVIAGKGVIGSGPFMVEEWSKGERIQLTRFDDYWQGPAPEETILSLTISEWSTKYLMFREGDIDVMSPASPVQAEQVIALPATSQTYVTPIRQEGFIEVCYFGHDFDETKAPSDNQVPGDFFSADVHMRKAFSYSLPYETYVNEVYLGWAEPAKGVLNTGWPGYYENFPYTYDPVKAEEEFKLAYGGKYWDEGFQITYAYQAWAADTGGVLGELLAQSIADINPKFKVIPTVTTWGDLVGGGTPFGTMVAENGPDAYYIQNVYSGTQGYAGRFGYRSSEVDDLLAEATATSDAAAQEALYIDAQKILEDDIPGMLTVYTPAFFAAHDYVSGFQYSIAWITDPGWVYTLEKTP
jgi:peptide/nickel transport system substrate-binding protein